MLNFFGQSDRSGKEVNLRTVYDAVIVGSGAAGGMAAYVLAGSGLKVLMLEAGKKVPDEELKSTEWPYEHPRRGDVAPIAHALSAAEYKIRNPPYATHFTGYKHVYSYTGGGNRADYKRNIVVDEKDHPYTGTDYAWVRAHCLGGKTNIWGRVALRFSDYDFKAKSHDGYGDDWPVSYEDVAPYYDRVDRLLGISGHKENLPQLPDGVYQRPVKLNYPEMKLRGALAKTDKRVMPAPVGVTTDGVKNKYRSKCYGRGACTRGGGCDIHASFDSPTGLIYPAIDTGNLTLRTGSVAYEIAVDNNTGRARGVKFIDTSNGKTYEAQAKAVIVAASTLESARLLLLSKSEKYPNGIGNSSGHVGHNFCEHVMGPGATALVEELVGKPRTLDDGRPNGFYIPRYRNLKEKHKDYIRGFGFQGSSGVSMFPNQATGLPGFGAAYKKAVREQTGAYINIGGFGEVLARYENQVSLDPKVKDKWGVPVLKFNYEFSDNERRMAADMADQAAEILEAGGYKVLSIRRDILTEGWSIHELGTSRMGTDPKTSVLNQFQQSHDMKNLFVVDGSSHVSAGNVNPTWTIMALAMRSCEYLADQLKKGTL
ncbi:MAG: GMC family oxidoreductase [Acidobacteriota bacterium]|nr:GMC family oxidoreductase [Acidobacteriota bacterium]